MSECRGKLSVCKIFRKLIIQLLGIPVPGYAKYVLIDLCARFVTDVRLRNHEPPHPVHQYAELPQRRIQGGRTGNDAHSQGQLIPSYGS